MPFFPEYNAFAELFAAEKLEITPEQYRMLMQGLEIVAKHPIEEVRETSFAM